MCPRRFVIHFYLVAMAFLFTFFLQTASAAPAPEPVPEPSGPTPGEVTSQNRNLACFNGTCYYKTNGTTVTNGTDGSTVPSNSTDSTSEAHANGAFLRRDVRITLQVAAVGTSLLFVL